MAGLLTTKCYEQMRCVVFFTVGEECVFDMDCQSDGNFCDENICVPVAEGNKNALFNDGE